LVQRKAHWPGAAASAAAIETSLSRLLPVQCSEKLGRRQLAIRSNAMQNGCEVIIFVQPEKSAIIAQRNLDHIENHLWVNPPGPNIRNSHSVIRSGASPANYLRATKLVAFGAAKYARQSHMREPALTLIQQTVTATNRSYMQPWQN
jgi:hypothetical protein